MLNHCQIVQYRNPECQNLQTRKRIRFILIYNSSGSTDCNATVEHKHFTHLWTGEWDFCPNSEKWNSIYNNRRCDGSDSDQTIA